MRTLLSIAVIVFSLVGCTSPTSPVSKTDDAFSNSAVATFLTDYDDTPLYGAMGMFHWRLDGMSRADVFQTSGSIFNKTTDPRSRVNAGSMFVSTVEIEADPNSDNIYESTVAGEWGQSNVPYGFAGANGIPSFSATLHAPLKLVLSNEIAGKSISRSRPITLQWNADTTNTKGVLLNIRYRIITSNLDNPALPDTAITFTKLVPDIGSYEITTQDLAAFPVGGVVDLGIMRGSAAIEGTDRKYLLYAITTAFGECSIAE